jgi:hypothetical protein
VKTLTLVGGGIVGDLLQKVVCKDRWFNLVSLRIFCTWGDIFETLGLLPSEFSIVFYVRLLCCYQSKSRI